MAIFLKINGKKIKARKGMTVLEAAKKEGIYIPTLCDHPLIDPSGSCRICVVEVKGKSGFPTACTLPVTDGMDVRTDTPELRALRRNILELTLSEHPYTCLVCERREGCDDYQGTIRKVGITTGCQYCPKHGSCELQHLVDYLGIEEIEFPIAYRSVPVEQDDPFFDRDYNLCVFCGRCVRMCNDVRQNGTLTFGFRGDRTVVGTAFGKSHIEAGCEFCGACVDVCPTGALFDKRSKWEGCADKSIPSVCSYCSVGCSLDFNLNGEGLVSTTPHLNGTLNKGHVCVRGRFGIVDMVHHPKRLTKPMVKQVGGWIETSWKEALSIVAEKLAQFRGDTFGCTVPPQVTNEDAYTLHKFTRDVMKSKNLSNTSAFARDGLIQALLEIREANVPNASMEDIDKADLIVVWGADLPASHPIISLRVKQVQKSGAKLIVVDPRMTKLADRADFAVQVIPGTDRFLIAGLLKQLVGSGHVKDITGKGWDIILKTVEKLDASSIERKTGVSAIGLETFISYLTQAKNILFLFGSELALQESAQDAVFALLDLALSLKNAKIMPVLGESNLMGSIETGCLGRSISEIIAGIEDGQIRCLYTLGEFPEPKCLDKLEFLVVQSVYSPDWMDKADVVLPAAHWNEGEGTAMNFEGRLQRIRRTTKPPGDARPDWWICSRIAQKLGVSGFAYRKSSDIFAEITSVVPSFKDLTPGRLGRKGLHIEFPKQSPSDGHHEFLPFKVEEDEGTSVKGYAFRLISDWNMFGYRNGTFTESIVGMEQILSTNKIQIHPKDAERIGVQNGENVRIKSKNGLLVHGIAEITDRIPKKTVFTRFGPNAGPGREIIEENYCSVKIEKGAYE